MGSDSCLEVGRGSSADSLASDYQEPVDVTEEGDYMGEFLSDDERVRKGRILAMESWQTPGDENGQSHLLCTDPEHRSPSGLRTQSPPVCLVHT